MDNFLKFLAVAIVAICGLAGCARADQPDPTRTQTSDSIVGEPQMAGDTSSKDVFRIYDEFVAADAVAKKCGISSAELDEHHRQNFVVVTRAVRSDLMSRHGRAEATLDEFLRGRDELIRDRTLAMLEFHPCDSADAKAIIDRYKAQSRWKIQAHSSQFAVRRSGPLRGQDKCGSDLKAQLSGTRPGLPDMCLG